MDVLASSRGLTMRLAIQVGVAIDHGRTMVCYISILPRSACLPVTKILMSTLPPHVQDLLRALPNKGREFLEQNREYYPPTASVEDICDSEWAENPRDFVENLLDMLENEPGPAAKIIEYLPAIRRLVDEGIADDGQLELVLATLSAKRTFVRTARTTGIVIEHGEGSRWALEIELQVWGNSEDDITGGAIEHLEKVAGQLARDHNLRVPLYIDMNDAVEDFKWEARSGTGASVISVRREWMPE